ncbi:hypothetical protein ACFY78_18815 [Streptomyces olindensis]|uniref:hypothetical protein n=1 Tax=Streptomyces olindensis TaxID=358823 RepID=UPI003678283F
MTTEITEPITQANEPDITLFEEQAPVVEALAALVRMFGHLPKPYITLNRFSTALGLQLDSPSAFEQWRTALQVAPDAVDSRSSENDAWLCADGVFRGVAVRLTGFGLVLPGERPEDAAVVA